MLPPEKSFFYLIDDTLLVFRPVGRDAYGRQVANLLEHNVYRGYVLVGAFGKTTKFAF